MSLLNRVARDERRIEASVERLCIALVEVREALKTDLSRPSDADWIRSARKTLRRVRKAAKRGLGGWL